MFDCRPLATEIINTVKLVRSEEVMSKVKKAKNPYECMRGEAVDTSLRIAAILRKELHENIDLKKTFYNLQGGA